MNVLELSPQQILNMLFEENTFKNKLADRIVLSGYYFNGCNSKNRFEISKYKKKIDFFKNSH